MKPRTLAILFALVAGLGAFVWLYEREQPSSEEREKLALRVLGIDREEIARIELHAGDRTTELVRSRRAGDDAGASDAEQDEWRLRRPIDFRADYWQADGLVRTLAELERIRELEEYEPEQVGLDQPRGRVVVELESGETRELRIGAEVPGSGNVIVAVEGRPGAFVVAGTLWESLAKDAAEWRDKDLFAAEREDVVAMTLERTVDASGERAEGNVTPGAGGGTVAPASTVRLVRDGERFVLAEPIADRADDDAVNGLLRELTGLAASAFLDAPPPLHEIGLDPPRARLTVALDEGEPFVLLWGSPKEGEEESYAQVGDLVVTTTAALDEAFERAPADWRSRAWSTLPVFEIDEVTVIAVSGSLTVTRDEGSWRRGEDAIEYGPVSDFLYAIDDAEAERIATPEEVALLELGQPELTVDLAAFVDEAAGGSSAGSAKIEGVVDAGASGEGDVEEGGGAKKERLELYASTPENLVPARAGGRDAILLLRRETRDVILAKLEAVRAARPAGEELGQVP